MLQPLPRHGPRPPPVAKQALDVDGRYTTVPNFGRLGNMLDQDTDNFKRQWAGMRTSLKQGQARIRHFHQVLDSYLA